MAPRPDGEWLGRLDALADRLAGLDDRALIIDQVVSEAMQLLPADEVRVYADAATITAPSFSDESDGAPARAIIPLVIAGRHFGAIEIAMKRQRAVGPGERALSVALARQCALAIDSMLLRQARRADIEVPGHLGAAPVAVVASLDRNGAPPSLAGLDLSALQAAVARLESDVRALAKLARSAELPPASWVDRAEATALRRLDEVRAQIGGRVENAA
ncbi:MAG TPA: hypothetical protein VFH68_13015 [Polyangia bacterium]|nr:hypothetical protein [Polyangia bacterium]